jgi:periplasmic protein TonB
MNRIRKLCSFIFFLIPLCIYGQDTIFYNSNDQKVKIASQADYYQTLVKESIGSNKLIERSYYMNGQMREEIYYLDLSKKKKEGTQRFWFRNGQLKSAVDFVDNKMQGSVLTYWQNGRLKRKDSFENNKFLSGACFDSTGNPIEHFDFLVFPSFPGGEKMLLEYMRNNIRYPSIAAENGIQGKVVVQFVIKKDGTPTNFFIKTSVDRELDREAIRVVKAMPIWKPCIYDGEPLDFWYLLPVVFHMQ